MPRPQNLLDSDASPSGSKKRSSFVRKSSLDLIDLRWMMVFDNNLSLEVFDTFW
jgi:hypothetical protein